jgi:HEAT repeat protein
VTEDTQRALADAIAAAISETRSEDEYWRAVVALRESGATTSTIASLTSADDPRLRAIVPDVLRVPLNTDERTKVAAHLRLMLKNEESPRVLEALIAAFNELAPPDLADTIVPFAANPSADVRHAAAVALGGSRDERAIEALLVLSSDADERVKNWAVFGLGSQLGKPGLDLVDSEKIRTALAERITDSHEETRAEATLGLALRGDSRALPIVIDELERGTSWCQYVEAAYHLASPALCPALRKFLEGMDDSDRKFWETRPKFALSAAIKVCCGGVLVSEDKT